MAATESHSDSDSGADPCLICVICLDSSGNVTKMPCGQCRDKFVHADCLLPWILRNGSCPTCRGSLVACNHDVTTETRVGSMELARTPYIWPWIMLIINVTASFGIFSTHMNAGTNGSGSNANYPTIVHDQYRLVQPTRLSLDIAQYAVLITSVIHMIGYYGLQNERTTRVSTGFMYWMLFVIFVALLPPFVFALSFTADAVLLLITYAVLIASTIPAMAMRSHQWRLSNVTTSILFCCSTLGVKQAGDVRLVLIMTLFGHYLSIATVWIAQQSESQGQGQGEGESMDGTADTADTAETPGAHPDLPLS
jgi:hypothetical protein